MTDAAASPRLLRTTTAVPNLPRARHRPMEQKVEGREWLFNRVHALSRLLRIGGQPAVVDPDSRRRPATDVKMALADAVRQQLTKPGSIPPQRQLQLILDDRAAHDLPGSKPPVHTRSGWTPFSVKVESDPYRPIAENRGPLSDRLTRKDAWWDSPAVEFVNP
jgi:hypothetical protein